MFTSELTPRQQESIRNRITYLKQCYDHYRNTSDHLGVRGLENLKSANRWLNRYGQYTRSYLCNHALSLNSSTDEVMCARCKIIVE